MSITPATAGATNWNGRVMMAHPISTVRGGTAIRKPLEKMPSRSDDPTTGTSSSHADRRHRSGMVRLSCLSPAKGRRVATTTVIARPWRQLGVWLQCELAACGSQPHPGDHIEQGEAVGDCGEEIGPYDATRRERTFGKARRNHDDRNDQRQKQELRHLPSVVDPSKTVLERHDPTGAAVRNDDAPPTRTSVSSTRTSPLRRRDVALESGEVRAEPDPSARKKSADRRHAATSETGQERTKRVGPRRYSAAG